MYLCKLRWLHVLLYISSTCLHRVPPELKSACFLVYSLHTLPMFDDLCLWESVQQPVAARRLLYFIRAVTGYYYLNDLEADE